ncbi:unnamed protein product, partial [Rotaria sp. Silwood1]
PQIHQFLSGDKFQQLQQQFFGTVLTAAGNHWSLPNLSQAIQQLVSQFVPQVSQMRIDWGAIAQQALNALPGVAISVLGGLLGKREATDARFDLGDILALYNKLSLDKLIPQIHQFLSGDKFQQLQQQFFGTVLTAAGNHWSLPNLAQAIQQLVSQFVPEVSQMRIDWGQIAQQALNALPGVAISVLGGLLGKREATDARFDLDDVLALYNKLSLDKLIPQIHQFLSGDKFQQLQQQFFGTVLTAAGNHWSLPNLAQAIQQLVTQFVPGASQMRIDWGQIAQQALNALPGVAISVLGGLLGKREATDARFDLDDVLALYNKLSLDKLIPQIHQFLSGDKFQQLQQQFFGTVLTAAGNHWSLPNLSQAIQQLVSQFVPEVSQMRINWEQIAQHALSALPGVAMGILSAIGKREATDGRLALDDVLALYNKLSLDKLIPQIHQFLSGDKFQQLQQQFLGTVLTAAGNHWSLPNLAQAIQQLVSQFVPEVSQMRIDWEGLGQTALNTLASVGPGLLVTGLTALFGKREATDARLNLDDVLALYNKLSLDKLIPQIHQFLSGDKFQQLQQQFFGTVLTAAGNHWSLPNLSQAIQQLVTQFVPQVSQMRIDWEGLGQTALNTLASVGPGLLVTGLTALFGFALILVPIIYLILIIKFTHSNTKQK